MSLCHIISGASNSKLPVLISSSDCHFMCACVCQGGWGKYARSLDREKTVALYKCASVLLLIRSQDGVNCIVIQLRVCAVFFCCFSDPYTSRKGSFWWHNVKKRRLALCFLLKCRLLSLHVLQVERANFGCCRKSEKKKNSATATDACVYRRRRHS